MLLNLTVSLTSSDVTAKKGFIAHLVGHSAHMSLFVVSECMCVCSRVYVCGQAHATEQMQRSGDSCVEPVLSSYLYVGSRINSLRSLSLIASPTLTHEPSSWLTVDSYSTHVI